MTGRMICATTAGMNRMNDLEPCLAFAHRLADASGDVLRRYFGQPVPVDAKADHSPVTIADRKAEQAIRELIQRHYPEHGIYGEEFGTTHHSPLFTGSTTLPLRRANRRYRPR